jgi:hypothetical protein
VGIVSLFDKNDVKTAEEAFAKVKELNPSSKVSPQIENPSSRPRPPGSDRPPRDHRLDVGFAPC